MGSSRFATNYGIIHTCIHCIEINFVTFRGFISSQNTQLHFLKFKSMNVLLVKNQLLECGSTESEIRNLNCKDKCPAQHDLTGHFTKLGGRLLARQAMVITEKIVKYVHKQRTSIVCQAHGKSKENNQRCFKVAIMARQVTFWLVMWLKMHRKWPMAACYFLLRQLQFLKVKSQ